VLLEGRIGLLLYDFAVPSSALTVALVGMTPKIRCKVRNLGTSRQSAGGLAEDIVYDLPQSRKNRNGGQRQEYEQESVLDKILSFFFLPKCFDKV
jgi:hypothetical protein